MRIMSTTAAISLGLSACTNVAPKSDLDDASHVTSSSATIAPFTKLVSAGPDSLVVVQGDAASIRAEGPAEVLDTLRYRLQGDTLVVGRKSGSGHEGGPVTITLTVPVLRELTIAGSGDAQVARLSGETGKASVAGSGDLNIDQVQTGRLDVNIAGSGDVAAAGQTRELGVSIAGRGTFKARELRADQAAVNITGSGDAEFASDGQVKANIMGSGDVAVAGKAHCELNKMGSGSLHCG